MRSMGEGQARCFLPYPRRATPPVPPHPPSGGPPPRPPEDRPHRTPPPPHWRRRGRTHDAAGEADQAAEHGGLERRTILPLGGGGPCEAWGRGTRGVSCPIHVARLRPCPSTTLRVVPLPVPGRIG